MTPPFDPENLPTTSWLGYGRYLGKLLLAASSLWFGVFLFAWAWAYAQTHWGWTADDLLGILVLTAVLGGGYHFLAWICTIEFSGPWDDPDSWT